MTASSGSVSWGSSPCTPAKTTQDGHMTSALLAWAVAPEWLTTAQAAQLMGPHYTTCDICTLLLQGHIAGEVARDQILIDSQSLSDYRDALWETADE